MVFLLVPAQVCGLSLARSVTARQLSFRSRIASLGNPSSSCIPCPPVHYTTMFDIVICGRCHKSGHRAPQCPEAPSGNASSRGARGPPPAPCWTCELIPGADALHWGDECPVAAKRPKNRECTLCGSKHHWKKGCDKYIPEKHTAKNPKQHISLPVPVELIGHGACAAVQKTNTRHAIAPLSVPPSSSLLAKIKKILLTSVSGVRFEATICASA